MRKYELRQYADDLSIHVRETTTDTTICAVENWAVGEAIVEELNKLAEQAGLNEKTIEDRLYDLQKYYSNYINSMTFSEMMIVENVLTRVKFALKED